MQEQKKKEYRKDDTPPSRMFLDSLHHGHGSDSMECTWCGRYHMCPDNEYDERDDMDREQFKQHCIDMQKDNPEGVVLHWDTDSVMGYDFNGINFVVDCPCNGLHRYETFIWAEKNSIREYLKRRVDQELEWWQQEKTKNLLQGIDPTADKDREGMWWGY